MRHLSLAARYRPQKFSDIIGQPLAASALSRAAAAGRPAPAYLLSGTRGVGKTTIARVFAKALNCEHGPSAEPCNECGSCARVTGGNHVDVSEIDGASNTGVDDVRALRDNIGYMPMEGRFKIFIIDEAHMLSRNAFNALLKTLEEPPPHTVFIFATTEAHKFPATIVSRCQHFVFRHLPQEAIASHLEAILKKEGIRSEPGAIRLLARRAAGSVRDSLSLLDQVLALCGGELGEKIAREALGLAGQELFGRLLDAISKRDCAEVAAITAGLLQGGVDIGFFVRELAANLRSLFLVRQTNGAIIPALNPGGDEAAFLRAQAGNFSLAHLHAAWQMVLESQRALAQSPDPGAALELLLLNLALLPALLPVGEARPLPVDAPPAQKENPPAPKQEEKQAGEASGGAEAAERPPFRADWKAFADFCRFESENGAETPPRDIWTLFRGGWSGGKAVLEADSPYAFARLDKNRRLIERTLSRFAAPETIGLELSGPKEHRSEKELLKDCENHPAIRALRETLGATVVGCEEKKAGDET